jgi:hypothetical protein
MTEPIVAPAPSVAADPIEELAALDPIELLQASPRGRQSELAALCEKAQLEARVAAMEREGRVLDVLWLEEVPFAEQNQETRIAQISDDLTDGGQECVIARLMAALAPQYQVTHGFADRNPADGLFQPAYYILLWYRPRYTLPACGCVTH